MPVPVSPSASLTLLDVLHKVPRLPELLTADAQKALSAVSRSLRERRMAQARVVTVPCEQDLRLINKWSGKGWCRWPLLSLISLCTYRYPYVNALPIHHQRLEAHVYISSEKEPHAVLSLLRPLHTPANSSAWVSTAAQQLANHMAAKWPELSSFGMGCVRLDAVGTAIIAQLAQGKWPSLRYLGLSDCRLGAQGVLPLSQGKWPGLQVLQLSGNCLDAEGMALLANGNWPLLKDIQLNENPALDAVAVAHLSAANWPLQTLELSCMPFTSAMAAELAKLQLPSLTWISLSSTHFTADAASELAKADWPVLSYLCLNHNNLNAGAILSLYMMHLPALTQLCLKGANIAAEAVYWLSLCSWPLLKTLDLSYNRLDAEDVKQLATGVWPQLQSLQLASNPFGRCGLQQLIKGNWPQLNFLDISHNKLEKHDSQIVLGLDPYSIRSIFSQKSRLVSPTDACMWPKLTFVIF